MDFRKENSCIGFCFLKKAIEYPFSNTALWRIWKLVWRLNSRMSLMIRYQRFLNCTWTALLKSVSRICLLSSLVILGNRPVWLQTTAITWIHRQRIRLKSSTSSRTITNGSPANMPIRKNSGAREIVLVHCCFCIRASTPSWMIPNTITNSRSIAPTRSIFIPSHLVIRHTRIIQSLRSS